MRELRIKRKGIESAFSQQLELLFRHPPFLNSAQTEGQNKLQGTLVD